MEIDFNQNLSKVGSYTTPILQDGIKRMNANESADTILNYNILMKNVAENLNLYPEKKYFDLIKYASIFYNVDESKIIPTNGSDEAIDLCIRTFCNPNDTILVCEPTFSMYKQYAITFGLNIKEVFLKENDITWDINENEIIQTIKQNNIKMCFLPNPLANIGKLIQKDRLLKIIKSSINTIFVIDEAYIEFCNIDNNLFENLIENKNLIILRTFSKFFGLAGVRLGFLFTTFANDIMKIKSPYNVNSITCQIGINVFKNITKDIIKQRQNNFLQKRKELEVWLKQFKEVQTIFQSDTNFVFVKLNCLASEFAKKIEKDFSMKIKALSGTLEKYCRVSTFSTLN